jgi:hypothetical protein
VNVAIPHFLGGKLEMNAIFFVALLAIRNASGNQPVIKHSYSMDIAIDCQANWRLGIEDKTV